jgi:hypothetical protein
MAHRTMYSLIPPSVFDPIAARWAARGAKDIIFYGAHSVFKELAHYSGKNKALLNKLHKFHFAPVSKDNLKQYSYFLKECADLFNEPVWLPSFGGAPWAKIASTLSIIAFNYEKLLNAEKNSPTEEALLKKIIILLNLFDGLCHNTASIYDDLLRIENKENGYPKTTGEIAEDVQKATKIRDLSELPNPKHLFNEVKDIVYPKFIYKDYETTLKSNPKFYQPVDVETDLYFIIEK